MSVLILLVPLSLLIALGWVIAYIWSVRNDQLEDMVGPSVRILQDDSLPPNPSQTEQNASNPPVG